MHSRFLLLFVVLALVIVSAPPAAAQDSGTDTPPVDGPPFSLPFSGPPGPGTWLYQQHYGNTTQAFNYGNVWYEFGQGLHFGVDFEAACGTAVRAIADGVVTSYGANAFGAGPYNLVLNHPGTGYASLYGHLLRMPDVSRGQAVKRGEVIGLSGDPDGSCESRPHLHLEIRSTDYQTAYNPLPFFDVNWHMLASVGPYNTNFQQDLAAPRRWMRLENQPDIRFGGDVLNNYTRPWPLKLEIRPPVNPPLYRALAPLPDDVQVTITAVTDDAWSVGAWWEPGDSDAVYVVDAIPGQESGVFRQPLDGSPRTYEYPAPPALTSPDGSITVARNPDGTMRLTRRSDGATWDVDTNGVYPAVSPDNTRILWELVYGEIVPGTSSPSIVGWAANLDGSMAQRVYSSPSSYSMWLDDHRVLVVRRTDYRDDYRLTIVDLNDDIPDQDAQLLGTYDNLHGLQIAPGGEWIAFYLAFQDDPRANGVYVQRTEPGSRALPLRFFGAYRWRDAESLFVLSYDGDQDAHALGVVDVQTRRVRWLTEPAAQPIRVANGEWSVAPDGTRIVFIGPADYGLHMIDFSE